MLPEVESRIHRDNMATDCFNTSNLTSKFYTKGLLESAYFLSDGYMHWKDPERKEVFFSSYYL